MRDDMSKVIVERPRIPSNTRRGRIIKDTDLYASHEGMRVRHVYKYNGKQLNENLAPLVRFIRSRVGQNWDTVYSEICANIRITNAVQEHIRVHVAQYVETRTSIDQDGEIWINNNRPSRLSDGSWIMFYVHPVTGILCENQHRKSLNSHKQRRLMDEKAKRDAIARSLPGGVELRLYKGHWYHVEVKPIPQPRMVEQQQADGTLKKCQVPGSAYDVILDVLLYRYHNRVTDVHGTHHQPTWNYCASKRQLNREELKRFGLSNNAVS
jgi:hypothetical protein